MKQYDRDLCSIQETRILAENASKAQSILKNYTDDQFNQIIDGMIQEVNLHIKELAKMSCQETGFGNWQDKYKKNQFVCQVLTKQLKTKRYIGIIREDIEKKTIDVGVAAGVIAAFLPSTNPVSTTIYKTLIAIKSGNAIIFSPHPSALTVTIKVLDILQSAAQRYGLPAGAISYLRCLTKEGAAALMSHRSVARVLITGVPSILDQAMKSGKTVIYGGAGNGPAFIERTADLNKAVNDIILSKTFDYGTVSAAEQSVVVEQCIAAEVKQLFQQNGGYFLTEAEAKSLGSLFFCQDGSLNKETIGKSALDLAAKANIQVPKQTKVLLLEQHHVVADSPYSKQKLCPVLTFFVEDDWRYACEKCIELLIGEESGHTLVIHSRNEEVIREFALKKPVSRVLVNTPAVFGGMGATTNLFPAMTLGSATSGYGVTADNVSPDHLIYIRKVGYGVRNFDDHFASRLEVLLTEIIDQTECPGINI